MNGFLTFLIHGGSRYGIQYSGQNPAPDLTSPGFKSKIEDKMQKSEKFFIFSWKELLVLVLVAMTAIGFFFTLGLHYGKKLTADFKPTEMPVATLEPGPEAAPPREVLEQGSHKAESEVGEVIREATEKGLEENQMKVEQPKEVNLPEHKVEEEHAQPVAEAHDEKAHEEKAHEEKAAEPGYAIQLGSYPNQKDAQKRVVLFGKRGIKTGVRTAMVNGETRYRVVLPGFDSRKAAEAKGKELKGARKIESFVVIKAE